MDDVPSRPTDSSRTENEDAPRGIYDVATEFAVMYREIARGAQDFLGKRCAREEFFLVVQNVAIEAWKQALAHPGCFARGELRRWASRNAHWRYLDLKKERRKNAFVQRAIELAQAAGNHHVQPVGSALEEAEERRRAIVGALQLLDPELQGAVIGRFFREQSEREAAAELGITKGKLERRIKKALRVLARALRDWDPRAPRDAERAAPNTPRTR